MGTSLDERQLTATPAETLHYAPPVSQDSASVAPVQPVAPPPAEPEESHEHEAFRQPTRIGRYLVLEMIGVGGMGVVCTAYDPKLDRKVALKLIRERGTKRRIAHGRARLIREAQALAKLSHPNIITVHDVDTFDGKLYMAMEYVEGHTLSEWLKREPRTWRDVIDMFDHAGRGLAAAHAAGIVHRDFKPSNVLIGDDGRVRVLDFGLAKTNESETSYEGNDSLDDTSTHSDILELLGTASGKLTQAGRIIGTPAYMAPEQHLGGDITPLSDQFSFAVALYESLYHFLPFGNDSQSEAFWRATQSIVRPPPKETTVPPWIHQILLRALRARPEERFPSMQALLAALAKDPAATRRKRLRTGAVVVSGVVGVCGAAAALTVFSQNRCDGGEDKLAQIWNGNRHAQVEEALLGTAVPYAATTISRVQDTLDAYVSQWSAQHVAICEATVRGEQSTELLDLRMSCLDRQRAELRALVDLLEQPDEALVEQAVGAVYALSDPSLCADYRGGVDDALPADEAVRTRIKAVRDQLARVHVLIHWGRYGEAQTLAAGAKAEAFTLPHRPTQVEASLAEARAAEMVGHLARAEEGYREVVVAAAEQGAPRMEAEALAGLVYLLGVKRQRVEEALALRLSAEAALGRAGRPADLSLELALNIGAALVAGSRLDQALVQQEAALRLAEQHHREPHPFVASAHDNLAATLSKLGEHERAREHAARALALTQELFGDDHPATAVRELHHGHTLLKLSRLREAEAGYERARTIRRRVFGPFHPQVAEVQLAFTYLHLRRGDLERAGMAVGNAIDIFRSSEGAHEPSLIAALNTAGDVARRTQDFDTARRSFEEALVLMQRQPEVDPLLVARMHLRLCSVLDGPERTADGLAHCEQALEKFELVYKAPHPDKLKARHMLAHALLTLARFEESERQLSLALEELASLPEDPETAAELRLSLAEVLCGIRGRESEARQLLAAVQRHYGAAITPKVSHKIASLRRHL